MVNEFGMLRQSFYQSIFRNSNNYKYGIILNDNRRDVFYYETSIECWNKCLEKIGCVAISFKIITGKKTENSIDRDVCLLITEVQELFHDENYFSVFLLQMMSLPK